MPPGATEIRQVTRLAALVILASPIVHREARGETLLQDSDGPSLLTSNGLVAGIADHEHLEALGAGLVEQRAAGTLQAVCYPHGIFVVDGHHQHGRVLAERSEEHTSELQSRPHLVCRHLLEKNKKIDAAGFVKLIANASSSAAADDSFSYAHFFSNSR